MVEFSFRLRFNLGGDGRIGCDATEMYLTDGSDEILRLVGTQPAGATPPAIKDTAALSLYGRGYESEEQATEAGTKWTGYLQAAFARLGLGADFGRRTPPTSHFTPYGLKTLFQPLGGRVLNDVHGLMVFESEPPPTGFVAWDLQLATSDTRSADRLMTLVARARSEGYEPDTRESLAFDLYGAAFFEFSADSKYMMLMMAVETLASQLPRSAVVQEHVDRLIGLTRMSGLDEADVASMLGSLEHLKHESVIGACKRLTRERLDDRVYVGKSAVQFFLDAYALRNALAHGAEHRPPHDEIQSQAIDLRRFVGDLLSGPLLSFEG
jgi:hypothetical protein